MICLKFNKLLTTSAVALALVSTSVIPTFANEPSKTVETSSITTIEQLDERFNLRDVEEIPEGVIPVEFNSIEEAAKHLEQLEQHIGSSLVENNLSMIDVPSIKSASESIVRIGSFRTTKDAQLQVNMSYVRMPNGRIDLVSLTSQIIGDGAWSWPQSSHKTQSLDSGRSLGINITGTLRYSITVNGKLRTSDYTEYVYVEI